MRRFLALSVGLILGGCAAAPKATNGHEFPFAFAKGATYVEDLPYMTGRVLRVWNVHESLEQLHSEAEAVLPGQGYPPKAYDKPETYKYRKDGYNLVFLKPGKAHMSKNDPDRPNWSFVSVTMAAPK